MSDLMLGLLAWLGAAVAASLVMGCFIRMPDSDEESPHAREGSGLYLLPGYGWEEESIKPQVAEPSHAESNHPPRENM